MHIQNECREKSSTPKYFSVIFHKGKTVKTMKTHLLYENFSNVLKLQKFIIMNKYLNNAQIVIPDADGYKL